MKIGEIRVMPDGKLLDIRDGRVHALHAPIGDDLEERLDRLRGDDPSAYPSISTELSDET